MQISFTAVILFGLWSVAAAQTPTPDLLSETRTRAALTLDDFKKLALENNPTIRQAESLVQESAGQARQAGLYPNPSVGYQGEEIRGGSYRGGKQGAFVQQTFVLGGKLGLRRSVYEQHRRGDEIGVSEQRYRVLSDVSQNFYSALAAQRTVEVQRHLLSLAMDAVITARQLANVGQADAPDVLQAEVEAEQMQIDSVNAQRHYLQMFELLAAVSGKPDLAVCPLRGDLDRPPQLDAQQMVEEIVRDSPSVKRAQQEIVLAEAEVRSAKRETVPDLQIHAGAQNNFEPLDAAPSKEVGVHAFVTAGINLPIFNRNQGNVAAANAHLARAQAEVHRVQLSLRQDMTPLLQSYLASQLQAERYRIEIIPRAERAYKLYLEKYRGMGAAYPQVLVSQRTLFQLEVTYVQILEEVWRSAITLQNYTLSSGLTAPIEGVSFTNNSNLPNSGGIGVQ